MDFFRNIAFLKETFLISVALIFVNVVRTDASRPQAPVMPKTLHGICTNPPAQECIKLQKRLSLSTFPLSFFQVLSKILQHIEHIEIATTYLEIAKKKQIQTFFCQEKKNPPLILQDASNSTKGLKAFQSSIYKNYQKCWFRMTGSYVFD